MRWSRTLALGASVLVLIGACTTGGGSKPAIKIGSVGFDEARIMAEAYAQVLENAGYTVNRDGIGLGDRKVLLPALESGQIDLQPEYIGSGLAAGYGGTATGDPKANVAALQAILDGKGGGITVLGYTPAQDQNAFVVRKETADQYSLARMSDVAAVQDKLKLGLAKDCPTNPLCGTALKDAYGIDVSAATLLDACSTPMAQALAAKTIDLGELCSTQPDIIVNGFVLLQDDKQTQPADNIAPLVRNDFLAKTDKAAFSALLNGLSAKVDTATLAELYKEVSVDKKDVKDVVATWLKAQGLTK
ncbi:MAG TPA: ABC transporter substrate-binding protein [Candidatus Limnocylindrales bacterium]|jgi:osmoprotectant transport system substrate-binding protein